MTDTSNNTTPSHPSTVDPRPAFAAAVDTATGVISAVRSDHLKLPTPCDQMDVAQLLSHLIMVADRVSRAGRGEHPSTWTTSGPTLAIEEWVPAWTTAANEAMAEWATDETRLTRETALPWTTIPGAGVVAIYTNELLIHTWDLATAINVAATTTWDSDALAVADVAMHDQLPDADRGPMWAAMAQHLPAGMEWEPPFGNAAEVAEDAAPIERLVAWNGRSPDWHAE